MDSKTQLFVYNAQSQPCHILLQNENGPCPLLAAANCLLLKGSIELPSNIIGSGVVTIDQLVNVLAEKVLTNATGSDHHNHEVLTIFPSLQFGMDVNPKFTSGPTGVEYTLELNAFDLLHIELVHGWLLEPEADEYELIQGQTYNQLINLVIQGNDASSQLQQNPNVNNHDELSESATKGTIIKHFLDHSGHQLTQFGLTTLHEYLNDGQTMVFFRNNHFNTLTKHDGLLYLLVTDFGYANVPSVVWEKLDVIDGDTEYVTDEFKTSPTMTQQPVSTAATGEQLVANDIQSQADYQLALQLSRESSVNPETMPPQEDPDMEAARQASLREYNGGTQATGTEAAVAATSPVTLAATSPTEGITTNFHPPAGNNLSAEIAMGVPTSEPSQEDRDLMLALSLQREEEREQMQERQRAERTRFSQSATMAAQRNDSSNSNCVIS